MTSPLIDAADRPGRTGPAVVALRRHRRVAALVVTALIVWSGSKPEDKHITATFPSTTSLYEGAKVKVLGVAVGTVDSIEVQGTSVQVEISYDDSVTLPADVHALVVPPSIVGDRFIQLAPVWTRASRRCPTTPSSASTGRPSRSSWTTSIAARTTWPGRSARREPTRTARSRD